VRIFAYTLGSWSDWARVYMRILPIFSTLREEKDNKGLILRFEEDENRINNIRKKGIRQYCFTNHLPYEIIIERIRN
jgi:hypothetical protein